MVRPTTMAGQELEDALAFVAGVKPRNLAEPPASPPPEPDAPLPLSLEGIYTLVEQASARKIPVFSDALVKTAIAAHDLQAANAELRAAALDLQAEAAEFRQKFADAIGECIELRARAEKAEAEVVSCKDWALHFEAEMDRQVQAKDTAIRERNEARAELEQHKVRQRETIETATNEIAIAYIEINRLTAALAEMRGACARVVDRPDSTAMFRDAVGAKMIAAEISALPLPSDATNPTAAQERDGILRVIQATRATIRAEGPACCMNTLRHLVRDIKSAVPSVAGALSLPAAAEDEVA